MERIRKGDNMTIPCVKSALPDGEHRLDFKDDKNGIIEWLCLDCGESICQYSDNEGC